MPAALRPFLLVASFVNPHDIVLFPAWARRNPLEPSPLDPPPVPPAPTADEDLSTKPAAQIAFREAYYSGYGPAPAIERTYKRNAQHYRDLYYRLHAEVDGPIDRVRRAVTEGGSARPRRGAGAHLRPRRSARCARRAAPEVVQPLRRGHPGTVRHRPRRQPTTTGRAVSRADVARRPGADAARLRPASTSPPPPHALAESFSEVHPLPGRDLMPVVDGAPADDERRST